MVTLAEIADRAGVHVSTVSRALSPEPAGVGAAMVERIRVLAEELGYRRDAAAHTLRTGHSRMIGVLVPRLTDVALATIYDGIDRTATLAGYNTVVANTRDDPALQRSRLDLLLARRVDGLILGDSRSNSNLIPELRRARVPYVLVMRRLPRQISVTTDDTAGGRLAARHLLELGHERVGVVAGDPATSTGAERTRGFRDTYAEAGSPIPDEYVVESDFHVGGGRRAAELLLRLPVRPTAVFAVNDVTAIGVMGAVRDAGLQVGTDVAVVGYNDLDLAAQLPIGLTSVRSPLGEMGELSARMLLDMLNGRKVRSRRLPPVLVERASTLGSAGGGRGIPPASRAIG
jgi:LacI family transcriptional regulator